MSRSKIFLLLFLVVLMTVGVLMTACIGDKTLVVNGVKRSYRIYLPDGYTKNKKPYPVLFLLHGNPSTAWQMNTYTGMSATADKNNFILVCPNAVDKFWAYKDCEKIQTDLTYIKKLIAHLKQKHRIDENRLYFSGMSGGGIFCLILSQHIPEKIAAMAIVSGNMITENFRCKNKKQKIPLFLIHGTGDFLYGGRTLNDGSQLLLSAEQTLQAISWVSKNKMPPAILLPDRYKKDSSYVEKIDYRPENPVLFYKVVNGGHHWHNARFNANRFVKFDLGNFNRDFDLNQTIWDFVSAYKKET